MVEYAPEFEVSLVRPDLPPGVSQQRKVEAMTEEERIPEKEMPKLLVHEEAELKIAAAKPEPKVKKKTEKKKKASAIRKRRKAIQRPLAWLRHRFRRCRLSATPLR